MRLPADATLLVVGEAGGAGRDSAASAIAALIDRWRREGLPAIDARGSEGAFDDGGLEARLDELGATTLVLCGGESAVGRAAADAEALGFHAFVVRDACRRDGPSPGLGQAGTVVNLATTLAAAAVAKARQRRSEQEKP